MVKVCQVHGQTGHLIRTEGVIFIDPICMCKMSKSGHTIHFHIIF